MLMGCDFAKGVKYIGFKKALNGITTAIEEIKFGLFWISEKDNFAT